MDQNDNKFKIIRAKMKVMETWGPNWKYDQNIGTKKSIFATSFLWEKIHMTES